MNKSGGLDESSIETEARKGEKCVAKPTLVVGYSKVSPEELTNQLEKLHAGKYKGTTHP